MSKQWSNWPTWICQNEARGLWHFFHDSLVWLLAKHFGFSFSKGPDCFTPTAQVCHWASTGSSCDHHVRPLAEEDEVTTPSTFCENHPKKMVRAFSLPLSTCKSASQSCQLTEKKTRSCNIWQLLLLRCCKVEPFFHGQVDQLWRSLHLWQLAGKMPPTFKPLWVSEWAPTHRGPKKQNTLCVQLQ